MARTTIDDNTLETGIVQEDFSVILSRAFATYGLSVVTDRALPDARDGLKPVQRRILSGMLEARYLSSRPTVKSAEVVGLILGNYHPHGDASVYEAAARMSQPFTMRYPLIEGQGNMGSEDGDAPAAYRYTEMRLSPLAEAIMADIESDTVPLHPTYKQDPRVQEPDYLPGHIPPIVNPSSGIAVGLSTNIPPHNLSEVLRACIALLDRPQMTVEQLMTYMQGPDFCQGGRIIGSEGIKDYFTTGKGRIIVRAEVRLEETPRSRALVVTQIPPIGRDKVKTSIVKAINARKLEGLQDMRDESDTEKGTRIVLDLRRDADAAEVLTQLFRDTDLQIALSFQIVYLFGSPMQAARQPKQVGMIELLTYWNEHQIDVLTRRAQFELRKSRERLHVVEGLIIGSEHAEQIVKIFQQAEDRAAARKEIETHYQLSTIQSDVIASMTLAQVTRLDASKYVKEKDELQTRIAELERLLSDRKALVTLLKREMQQLIRQFGDERRTVIEAEANVHDPIVSVPRLHDREPLLVAFTRQGAIKSLSPDVLKPKGKSADALYNPVRGDEQLQQLIATTSQDYLLCVCSTGRVCQIATHRVPEGTRSSKGEPLRNLLELGADEEVVAIVPVEAYDDEHFLVTFSKNGKIKKSPLSDYKTVHVEGAPDMKLVEGDSVITALLSQGHGDYLIAASNGNILRFSDDQLRAQGRVGQGVAAMSLGKGATIVNAVYIEAEASASDDESASVGVKYEDVSLLVRTKQGLGKRVLLSEFPQKSRATVGVPAIDLQGEDLLAEILKVRENDTLLLIWQGEKGGEQVTALRASDLKIFPRTHKGDALAYEGIKGSVTHILNLPPRPIEE